MGEANERRSRGLMESFSLEKYPRDLLQRFMSTDQQSSSQNAAFRGGEEEEEEEEDSEDLELNLGLSLGGRFGVDKTKSKKLTRSSSIVGTMPIARDSDDSAAVVPPVSYPALVRTSSLPTETEEEWRKRKDLQTLRRMAAKRRRSEKQRNSAASSGKAEREDDERDKQQYLAALRAPIGGGGGAGLISKTRQPSSQGSVESHGGGSSSGMSELESKTVQGSSSYGEARSPAGHQSLQERSQEIMGPSGTKTTENKCSSSGSKTAETPSRKPNPGGNKGREIGMNAMEDMPCVFTKGDGPNGRRIDGILYRYGKGEDVRIMCVCHGNFLSPAEFVKHAGGGDVDHPLRHIVINPSSTSLLS